MPISNKDGGGGGGGGGGIGGSLHPIEKGEETLLCLKQMSPMRGRGE